jgi:hypothetical protein
MSYGVYDPKSILIGGIEFQPSDESIADVVKYYLFLAYTGHWLIMQMDTTDPNNITYRYAVGTSGGATYWSQRDTPGAIDYVTFDEVEGLL